MPLQLFGWRCVTSWNDIEMSHGHDLPEQVLVRDRSPAQAERERQEVDLCCPGNPGLMNGLLMMYQGSNAEENVKMPMSVGALLEST